MAWPVYSERFIHTNVNGTSTYTVPAGHRAVIKCIMMVNASAAAQTSAVRVAGLYVYYVTVQVSAADRALNMMCVAYAGEQIVGVNNNTSVTLTVSGFLFKVPSLLADEPPETVDREWVSAEPLPWEPARGPDPATAGRVGGY